ncbi:DUF4271 domain-containing protein [Chryseosolibacter indicus]|uniref:DUF4271 domain-containing protein n=1 Tax=Chryseosolibacter indicus TaxID=2782351 RepID=A0ABS5VMT5_9BACT|nr:DUF4271 domain-containing protein [Chryseosolibacter indicus]MBT1702681.1 DUF4271 domain-containing protein [Chryseosolibacter indicus]
MSKRFLFTFVGLLSVITLVAQNKFTIKKDLRSEWLQYTEGKYQPLGDEDVSALNSLHFKIEAGDYAADELVYIHSRKPFYIFVNGKLLTEVKGTAKLKIDSLAAALESKSWTFSLYQTKFDEHDLKTYVISEDPVLTAANDIRKPESFFRDFVVLIGLLLIVFFVVIIRLKSKLSSDYFSVNRILSLREGEDNQSHSRFAISSNMAFYVFASLLMSLYLLIVFYNLPDDYKLSQSFAATGFWGAVWLWLKLSVLVFCILFAKLVLIYFLSWLFGIYGIAGVHFFNWMRLLLLSSSSLIVILFVYYILRGLDPAIYITLLSMVIIFFLIWIVIVFLKLNNRVEHTMFHLFSYICATEVIPLLVTIKVLFQ